MKVGACQSGSLLDASVLRNILCLYKLENVASLGWALRLWSEECLAVRRLISWEVDVRILKEINRPGAWLLDCVHTENMAILGRYRSVHKVKYDVMDNTSLARLYRKVRCYLSVSCARGDDYGSSDNNTGNLVECLAWHALECDKTAIIIALAWHAHFSYESWAW